MSRIYSGANQTIAWLGPSRNRSDLAMDRMEDIARLVSNLHQTHVSRETLTDHGLPSEEDLFWPALGEIFQRKWFQRLWILQEAALAPSVLVYCGSKSVGWDALAHLGEWVSNKALGSLCNPSEGLKVQGEHGFSLIKNLRILRIQKWGDYVITLDRLLDMARIRDTTEPIDKVYAVLGMVDNATRVQIRVDYSDESRQQFVRTYTLVGHILMHQLNGLRLLTKTDSKDILPGLPSWCPNFRSPRIAVGLIGLTPRRWQQICLELSVSKRKDNDRNTDEGHGDTPHVATTRDGKCIILRGTLIDAVSEVLNTSWKASPEESWEGGDGYASYVLDWLDASVQFFQRATGRRGIVTEDILRTLITDHLRESGFKTPDLDALEEMYRLFRDQLESLRDEIEELDETIDGSGMRLVNEFYHALGAAAGGRRPFSTKGGRIGLGHRSIKAGDVVCIFKTAPVPLVLRPPSLAGESEHGAYTLVGEAYVHGVMNGEAFFMAAQENIQEQCFTIA
jgi:hypothetical protein